MTTNLESLDVSLTTTLIASMRKDNTGMLVEPSAALSATQTVELEFGSGSAEVNQIYTAARSLALSTAEELDLSGILVNPFTGTIAFSAVKALYIKNNNGHGEALRIGGAAANAWVGPFSAGGKYDLPDGETLLLVNSDAGWDVTADTGDLLKIEALDDTNATAYDIAIIGVE